LAKLVVPALVLMSPQALPLQHAQRCRRSISTAIGLCSCLITIKLIVFGYEKLVTLESDMSLTFKSDHSMYQNFTPSLFLKHGQTSVRDRTAGLFASTSGLRLGNNFWHRGKQAARPGVMEWSLCVVHDAAAYVDGLGMSSNM